MTSDCSTTTYTTTVTFGTGSIDVYVEGAPGVSASALETTSYSAAWQVVRLLRTWEKLHRRDQRMEAAPHAW